MKNRIIPKIKVVRDGPALPPEDRKALGSSVSAALFIHLLLKDEIVENFVTLLLDAHNRIIDVVIISTGTITYTMVSPRDVFTAAILTGAANIIVGHNHPSGEETPSEEDYRVTDDIVKVGRIHCIKVLDHIIVTPFRGRFYSFLEKGRL